AADYPLDLRIRCTLAGNATRAARRSGAEPDGRSPRHRPIPTCRQLVDAFRHAVPVDGIRIDPTASLPLGLVGRVGGILRPGGPGKRSGGAGPACGARSLAPPAGSLVRPPWFPGLACVSRTGIPPRRPLVRRDDPARLAIRLPVLCR